MIIPRIRIESNEVSSFARDAVWTFSASAGSLNMMVFILWRLICAKSFGKYKRTCTFCQHNYQ